MALLVQKPEGRIILTVDRIYLTNQFHITKGTLSSLEWERVTNSLLEMDKVVTDEKTFFSFDCERYLKNMSQNEDKRNVFFTCALITREGWSEEDCMGEDASEDDKKPFIGYIPFVSPIYMTDASAMLTMLKLIIEINFNNEYTVDKDVRLNIFEEWRAHSITPYEYDHKDLVIRNDGVGGWATNFNYRNNKTDIPSDNALFSQYKTKNFTDTYNSYNSWVNNQGYSISPEVALDATNSLKISPNYAYSSSCQLARKINIRHHNIKNILEYLTGGDLSTIDLNLDDLARYTRLLQSFPRGLILLTICPIKYSRSAYFIFSTTNVNYRTDVFYVDFESINGFSDLDWNEFIDSLENGYNSSVVQMYYENFYISINKKIFYVWKDMFDEDVPHINSDGLFLYSWYEASHIEMISNSGNVLLPEFSDLGQWYFIVETDDQASSTLLGDKRIFLKNFVGDEIVNEGEMDRFSYIPNHDINDESFTFKEGDTLFSQKSLEEIMNTTLVKNHNLVEGTTILYGNYNNAIYNYVASYMVLQGIYRDYTGDKYNPAKSMLSDICVLNTYIEDVYLSDGSVRQDKVYRIVPYAPVYHAEGIDYYELVPMKNSVRHKIWVNGNILRMVSELNDNKVQFDDYDMTGKHVGYRVVDLYKDGERKSFASWRGTNITITNSTVSIGIV